MFCVTKKNKICQLPPVTAGGMSGSSSNATLCKGELIQQSKLLSSFRDSENVCKGALVQCPRCFFLAFDSSKTVPPTRK